MARRTGAVERVANTAEPRPVTPIRPLAAAADAEFAFSMYEKQAKVCPRAVNGWFVRWRWTLDTISGCLFRPGVPKM